MNTKCDAKWYICFSNLRQATVENSTRSAWTTAIASVRQSNGVRPGARYPFVPRQRTQQPTILEQRIALADVQDRLKHGRSKDHRLTLRTGAAAAAGAGEAISISSVISSSSDDKGLAFLFSLKVGEADSEA